MRNRNLQEGQALLEAIVAMAIGVIAVTAFVSLATVSVRNSTFSKNQVTATKLAQEGIEAMITIRDQNSVGTIDSPATQWQGLFSISMSCGTDPQTADLTRNCAFDYILKDPSLCPPTVGPTPAPQRCIQNNTSSPYTSANWQVPSFSGFARKIRITDSTVANVKNITVFVWWTDSNGLHTSTLTRKLQKEKLQ